ncbi:DNA alkylation repair protein [Anaerolineales bacterium]
MAEFTQLKHMYNQDYVTVLAGACQKQIAHFDQEKFINQIFDAEWEQKALKTRSRHISQTLAGHLPDRYRDAIEVLQRIAQDALFNDYAYENMIFPEFVELYGLADWEASMQALAQFTQQSSGEFAVRPFIKADPARMMQQMESWSRDKNFHIRRLASEGCRPRLPWASQLPDFITDPSPIFPILENLKFDERDYVRRSVANNLNDIIKDHPDRVLALLEEWHDPAEPTVSWIIRHALRSLVKAGDPQALSLIGYGSEPDLRVEKWEVSPQQIAYPGDISLNLELVSTGFDEQSLLIDYVMHFVRAGGKYGKKVFKLQKAHLAAGETLRIEKKHSFRPISTRRYYAGLHQVEIQINGKVMASAEFELVF